MAQRTPKNYDGSAPTGKKIGELLPEMLGRLSGKFKDQPYLIVEAWPEVVGEKISRMTRAVSFHEGVLEVKVKNSSLMSLLSVYEKERLIALFRERFPKQRLTDISFKIG
ncbi:MAG: DUF721 domain-containing protein [Chlamydiia bacterium]|nr:DUF721 domain-containing protein [Chlamydiia bacterium]